MEDIITKQKNVIADLYKEKVLPVFLKRITEHQIAMQKIQILQKNLIAKSFDKEEKKVVIKALNTYKSDLEKVVEAYFSNLELEEENLFKDYYVSLDKYIETLEDTITRTQDIERFLSTETDSKVLRFRKKAKFVAFKISKIPLKIANIFRKNKKEVVFWQQVIPFKNVTSYYFKNDFTNNLNEIIDAINREISEITSAYWLIDNKIDEAIELFLSNKTPLSFSDEITNNLAEIPSLENRIDKVTLKILDVFNTTSLTYTNALYIADTIELSGSFFSTQNIENNYKSVLEKNEKDSKLWQNTFHVLESDWELDLEIFKIIFSMIFKYNELETSLEKRIQFINTELGAIKEYLKEVKTSISSAKKDADIKTTIALELKKLQKNFKKIIEQTTQSINSQELPLQINQFEESAWAVLESLSTKRAISSDTDYTTKTTTSSINYISPYELITYQSWPSLAEIIKQAKLDLSLNVTSFIEDINALSQVSEFNLESALSLFETDALENISTENTPKNVAVEGLERSEQKIEELKDTLANLNIANGELLLPSIDAFSKSILELTDTENITEIRLTIAKAKSIEKSKLLKAKVINTVKNFIPVALLFFKTKYKNTVTHVKKLLLRAGLYKEPTDATSDLSDFLKEAEAALDELPYVYQRLFRSETLQNEALFIGRKEALKSLEIAGETFGKNQYAASIIVGERGSGKTSLIHHFLNKNKKIPKATFLSTTENISEIEEFIAFLNSSFNKKFGTIQEWIQFFNTGKKRTIVLEDIQYLYFRKVGGFKVLDELSNLISETKNNVFWLVTSSKYAFQYLDKSIQLAELFAFNIEMNEIDKETIKEALIKRHKISGYNLYFEKPPLVYLSKKFLKSPVELQQEILKEEFFSDINKIAQSNFKIAFMYWIRSTLSVSGSTIYMRSLKSIDTSFLNKLAPAKLLLLNGVLLHERLSMQDIVALSSLNEQHTKNSVHSLLEKGLLILDDEDFYSINIFLYRQITTLLKSKNVIH